MDVWYWQAVDAVKVIDVSRVLDERLPGWLNDWSDGSYDRQCEAVKQFCADNNAHYYAADASDFSLLAARREAHEAGKKIVVVENLS